MLIYGYNELQLYYHLFQKQEILKTNDELENQNVDKKIDSWDTLQVVQILVPRRSYLSYLFPKEE